MEKMREEFEAWYEAHCAPLESDWFKRDSDFPDDYDYFPAQEAWAGWQASRAAQCVELPLAFADERATTYLTQVTKALDATGIRYT